MTTDTEKAVAIEIDVLNHDVGITFRWNHAAYERGVYTSRSDGTAQVGLHLEDAQELHRRLGEALA